ncbi:hypothetical protein O181_040363 [Austropuccinia psidii MF-1]|uniref:Uncharacterized protein n=1 Tax=Austropuccinia psidii MF-1 TaxID=1389203 RepID=A0A9Q3HCT0_9BASI|nr:hypothetical protein [Austropuccinia psidii MF-1]
MNKASSFTLLFPTITLFFLLILVQKGYSLESSTTQVISEKTSGVTIEVFGEGSQSPKSPTTQRLSASQKLRKRFAKRGLGNTGHAVANLEGVAQEDAREGAAVRGEASTFLEEKNKAKQKEKDAEFPNGIFERVLDHVDRFVSDENLEKVGTLVKEFDARQKDFRGFKFYGQVPDLNTEFR